MPNDLYDRDIVRWSETQAEFLRRLAAGERINADLDFENIIEEIQSVGRSQLITVQSLLKRAMEHLLKLAAFPHGPAKHWQAEVASFLDDASRAYAPSMRQRLDIDDLFRSARNRILALDDQGYGPSGEVVGANPYTLDDLLPSDRPVIDIGALVAKLRVREE